MADEQVAGTRWFYQRIRNYCEERTSGSGGYYGQEPYKRDFFDMFVDAFYVGLCGTRAVRKYNRRRTTLRGKSLPFADYAVSGESIRGALERDWLRGKNRTRDSEKMVEALCDWWDSWVYAWDRYPGNLWSPGKRLAKIRADIKQWTELEGTSK